VQRYSFMPERQGHDGILFEKHADSTDFGVIKDRREVQKDRTGAKPGAETPAGAEAGRPQKRAEGGKKRLQWEQCAP
ncbi:MAG: hypothetical protein LUD00_10180, partial [Prevotellaceae bacterium]|nr:hypothetical protein [Prevotellaceae bacterium]